MDISGRSGPQLRLPRRWSLLPVALACLLGVLASGLASGPARAHPAVRAGTAADGARPAPVSPGYPLFNDPTGPPSAQYRLVRHIDAEIAGAPRRSTIRLAAYSFALSRVSRRLIAAHRRGVLVRLVVDQRSRTWGSVRRLGHLLGHDVHARSFVKICSHSCRGRAGDQHAKFMTLSRTGHKHDVLLVGSMNFSDLSAQRQWNDLYTVADPGIYRQFRRTFAQMRLDRPQPRLHLKPSPRGLAAQVAPLPGWSARNDPVLSRLRQVRCRGAGAHHHAHTVLRISMHAWNGSRGVLLARKVAGLSRARCDIRVLYGVGVGRRVVHILHRAGVPARSGAVHGTHTHQKLMVLSGRFARQREAEYVWTGSHNWTTQSLANDEVTLRVSGARTVHAYRVRFAALWKRSGRSG